MSTSANGKDLLGAAAAPPCGIVDPGTSVDIRGITPHDNYAHPIVEFRCAREVICNAVKAEREGYDAFVIGHFQDAGLYEARSVVDIPVVALGEASMLYACQLGAAQRHHHHQPALHFLVSSSDRQIRPRAARRRRARHDLRAGTNSEAYESEALAAEVARLFAEQAKPLVARGCDVLIPGGGIPMLLFAAVNGHTVDGAPVINGIPIVVKMAEVAVKLALDRAEREPRIGLRQAAARDHRGVHDQPEGSSPRAATGPASTFRRRA